MSGSEWVPAPNATAGTGTWQGRTMPIEGTNIYHLKWTTVCLWGTPVWGWMGGRGGGDNGGDREKIKLIEKIKTTGAM